VSRVRSFDPNRGGHWEWRAWVAYYRREWAMVLVASVGLVRAGFGLGWGRTLRGAWLVLRANQLWAPYPHNDPDGARRCMERFYRLVAAAAGERLDTKRAAELEVEWWRAHRQRQHQGDTQTGVGSIVDALGELYAFLYACPPEDVRRAAELRAEAMDVSDRWVAEGCDLASPLLATERSLLVRSYAALLLAAHRPSVAGSPHVGQPRASGDQTPRSQGAPLRSSARAWERPAPP
jgi:hypothetical protein